MAYQDKSLALQNIFAGLQVGLLTAEEAEQKLRSLDTWDRHTETDDRRHGLCYPAPLRWLR